MLNNKYYKEPIIDKDNRPVFLDDNVQISSSDVLLGKDIQIESDFGYYKKGEYLSSSDKLTDIISALFKDPSQRQNRYKSLSYKRDFTYEIEYDNYDWIYGMKYMKASEGRKPAACSSFRVGKYHVRMYDWYYNNEVNLPITATAGKYKSVGVATNHTMTKTDLDNHIQNPTFDFRFDIIPFYTLDGINSNGVCVNTNVTAADYGLTFSTNPDIKDINKQICVSSVPRYVLDNCVSAKHAVDTIKNDLNIFGKDFHGYEFHFMISDINDTFVVEFVNGKCVIIDVNSRPVMTNFHIYNTQLNIDNTVKLDTVSRYGAGVERYNIIMQNLKNIKSESDIMDLIQKIKYTNAYDVSDWDKAWYTEFVGKTEYGDFTTQTDREIFKPFMQYAHDELFIKRTREDTHTWHTVHTSVYDLENKSFKMWTQELYDKDPLVYCI